MAEKKKKGEAVQYGDFELDDATIARIQQERADAASRVAQFDKTFVPTGSAFKDTALLSGTSRDVKTMRLADQLLDKAADRGATVRGQDIQLELGRGELDVNRDRNRVIEKGYDYQHEVGMGELGLNKDIFKATQDRYKEFGRPGDALQLAKLAADTRAGYEQLGYEMPEALAEFKSSYGTGVAKPQQQIIGEDSIYYNKPEEPKPHPGIEAISTALTTGPSNVAMPYAGMSIGKMAGEKIGKGLINLFSPVRNKVRGKVRKVN